MKIQAQAITATVPATVDAVPQTAAGTAPGIAQRWLLPVLAVAVFSGAMLVFLVEPMIAKMLLPSLGGTPAVWNTCMVFFQAMLLAGYLYAHALARLPLHRSVMIHAVALTIPLALLPFVVPGDATPPPLGTPVLWIFRLLLVKVGLPFLLISATAPLLQRWLSHTTHPTAHDPYLLYAASNAGSLLALIAYPLIVEPLFDQPRQAALWASAFVVFAALAGAAGLLAIKSAAPSPARPQKAPEHQAALTWPTRLRWISLAFVPSSLMLGVTQYLTTDVAPVPLLWIAPLGIYLLTFMIAFGAQKARFNRAVPRLFQIAAVVATMLCFTDSHHRMALVVLVHLGLLFLAGLLCHNRLAEQRPPPEHLTEFFLLIALGGVLGGAFNALVAPAIFNDIFEYPIALVLTCIALPATVETSDRRGRPPARMSFLREVTPALLIVAVVLGAVTLFPRGSFPRVWLLLVMVVPAFLVYSFTRHRLRYALGLGLFFASMHLLTNSTDILERRRNFFGAHAVTQDQAGSRHRLMHGTTMHGVQSFLPGQTGQPLAYYSRPGPVGRVFATYGQQDELDDVAVLGLGAGSLAAYGEPRRRITFYEIDPGIIKTATDPALFSFVSNSLSPIQIIPGDARLTIGKVPDGQYDLIVADAFSSDAIPIHLLTREAIALYFQKLRPDGLLLMNISNRYFSLEHVVAKVAEALGLSATIRLDRPTPAAKADGATSSLWVVLARNQRRLQPLTSAGGWNTLSARPGDPLWTDHYSNVLFQLRWLSNS